MDIEATDGFAVVFEAQSGLTQTMETDNSPLERPRLKASSKAIPAPPQSTPRPSTANNPTSPPAQGPTGTAGQSGATTTPMETDSEQPDETMGASALWETVVSPPCAPMVLQQLVDAEFSPKFYHSHTDHINVLTTISNSASTQRDSFIPTATMNDTFDYLWFTWLSASQYEDFNQTGSVPGYKDTRGDN
eukprot:2576695-Amphidinium_carterae.2